MFRSRALLTGTITSACIVLATTLLAGCNVIRPCTSAICGCWHATTYNYKTTILNSDHSPVQGIELFCPDTNEYLGSTDSNGEIAIRFRTKTSPGCGMSTCAKLGVMQNQIQIGHINLRLSNTHTDPLYLHDIINGKHGSLSSADDA